MSYTSAHDKVNHHLVLYHHFTGEGATQSKTVGLLYLVHTYNQDEPTVRPARTGLQQYAAEYKCIGETAGSPAFQDVFAKEWIWWGV